MISLQFGYHQINTINGNNCENIYCIPINDLIVFAQLESDEFREDIIHVKFKKLKKNMVRLQKLNYQ